MANIAIFFAEGYEEIEALTVVDLVRRAKLNIDMVSITDSKLVTSSHGVSVQMDKCLAEVDFDAVDMIVLPGGMPGTRNLEKCDPLMTQLDQFHAAGKYISAICAAPTILAHRGYLEGREACCYPSMEEELVGAAVSHNSCVVSDHITMARGMGCAIDFGLAIVARFLGQETADQLAASVVYQV